MALIEKKSNERDLEYGYDEEQGKNFLDFIIEYIRQSKEKPKLEKVT